MADFIVNYIKKKRYIRDPLLHEGSLSKKEDVLWILTDVLAQTVNSFQSNELRNYKAESLDCERGYKPRNYQVRIWINLNNTILFQDDGRECI